ncbi:MAG: HAD family hydrolase [Chthoniobacteraceae bacterium]
MKVRAVIFDVYHTLMHVGPPPSDAPERWQALCRKFFGRSFRLSLEEFSDLVRRIVLREHRVAHEEGVAFPEICWPQVVAEALKEVRRLEEPQREEFFLEHMRLQRSLSLMPGAAAMLRICRDRGLTMGIASNAQSYTLLEIEALLQPEGLSLEMFDPHLRFWSFENGFGKPNPHVFRVLGARLWARGVAPGAILMVGDRLDNDVLPSKRQGWQTWHLSPSPKESPGGNFEQLVGWLEEQAVTEAGEQIQVSLSQARP